MKMFVENVDVQNWYKIPLDLTNMPWKKLEKPLNFIVEKMRQPCPRYVSRWARIPCGITCWAWDPLSSGRNQFTVCYLTYQSEAVFGISSPFWCELTTDPCSWWQRMGYQSLLPRALVTMSVIPELYKEVCYRACILRPDRARFLQHLLHNSEEGWRNQADPQPKTVQQVTQQGQIQHVDSNPSWPLPSQQLAGPCGPKGCAPPRVHNGSTPTSPCRDFQWKMVPPRSLLGTFSVHPFDVHLGGMTQVQGDTATHISGQPTPHRELSRISGKRSA